MKICIADESLALHNSTALVPVFLHDLSFVHNLISLQHFEYFQNSSSRIQIPLPRRVCASISVILLGISRTVRPSEL